MTGHVFLVRGDLTKLSCDAFLVPTSGRFAPGDPWRKALGPRPQDPGKGRVRPWTPLNGGPRPWLVDTGGDRGTPSEWYVEGVLEALELATRDLEAGKKTRNERARPLIGVPLVGTGAGGQRDTRGGIVRALLDALVRFAHDRGVDLALVLREDRDYAAAQAARNELGATAWRGIAGTHAREADALAQKAREGRLALFLGAGVSRSAGLPLWDELLHELADGYCEIDPSQRALLDRLGELDHAALLDRKLKEGTHLGRAVATLLEKRSTHYALGHALLAPLPIREVVTTNYDALFELAADEAGRRFAVLPYARPRPGEPWLLKLHGCVSRPEDIVLTRDQYLGFEEERGALAGVVQTLLVTRHLVFVGFSLRDENFHRIAHAVKRAFRREARGGRFATVLAVQANPLLRELWEEDFEWVPFDAKTTSEAARLLEIFLDRLAAHAVTTTAHFFDPAFDALRTDPERELRDALETLVARTSAPTRATPAWLELEKALHRLGWRPPSTGPRRAR